MRNLALFLTACLVLYINSYVPWCARSFVVATQTDHPPHSALAVVMDGEAFLKQDFEDATSFKVVLKEEELIHLQRRRRKRPVMTSQGGDDASTATPTRRRTRRPRPAHTFAASTQEDGPVRTDGCQRLVWATSLFKAWDLPPAEAASIHTRLQVALLSARVHAPSLVPVLLYDGNPDAFTAWWETSGGRVVFTYTSLYKELSTCKGSFKDSERHARACRGSFLFLDLPDLMPNMTRGLPDDVSRDYVLHTAHDVLFLKDVDSCKLGSPKVLSVGRDHRDSGGLSLDVALVNVDGFGNLYDTLRRAAIKHKFQQPNCVQGTVFGAIPERTIDVLPNEFHWKGYWGGASNVALVDFYGPKPLDCLPCLTEFPEEPKLCKERCDATSLALFGFTRDMGVYYKWLMHVYHAFVETPVRFVPYNP